MKEEQHAASNALVLRQFDEITEGWSKRSQRKRTWLRMKLGSRLHEMDTKTKKPLRRGEVEQYLAEFLEENR